MVFTKVDVLRKIQNNERIPTGYDDVLLELQDDGYIGGLLIKSSSQNSKRKVMAAIAMPNQTYLTRKGEELLTDENE